MLKCDVCRSVIGAFLENTPLQQTWRLLGALSKFSPNISGECRVGEHSKKFWRVYYLSAQNSKWFLIDFFILAIFWNHLDFESLYLWLLLALAKIISLSPKGWQTATFNKDLLLACLYTMGTAFSLLPGMSRTNPYLTIDDRYNWHWRCSPNCKLHGLLVDR